MNLALPQLARISQFSLHHQTAPANALLAFGNLEED